MRVRPEMGIFARSLRLAAAAALSLQLAHVQTPFQGVIEGDVVEVSTGHGIGGARVRIHSGREDALFATADAQGHFRFAGLGNQSYQAEASYPGFVSVRLANAPNGGVPISLGIFSGGAQIRLGMVRSGAITGTVTDSAGVPIPWVTVTALTRYPIGGQGHGNAGILDGDYQYLGSIFANTNDLGEYRLGRLAPGTYYVRAARRVGAAGPPPGPGERETYYPHVLKPSDATPVEVGEGDELHADIQIARASGVKAAGRILGMSAAAAAGSQVWVSASPLTAGPSGWSGQVTGGGRFEATGLMPGSYRFMSQQAVPGASGGGFAVAAAQRIVEVGTSDLDGIDLTLEPTTDIDGSVVFEARCRAMPVWVNVGSSFSVYNLHPGAGGPFSLRHVISGRYKVSVQTEVPSDAFASSVKFGGSESRKDGFDVTLSATGPLLITMSCTKR